MRRTLPVAPLASMASLPLPVPIRVIVALPARGCRQRREDFALVWDGSDWSVGTIPTASSPYDGSALNSVTCVSSSDCWAVGTESSSTSSPAPRPLWWLGRYELVHGIYTHRRGTQFGGVYLDRPAGPSARGTLLPPRGRCCSGTAPRGPLSHFLEPIPRRMRGMRIVLKLSDCRRQWVGIVTVEHHLSMGRHLVDGRHDSPNLSHRQPPYPLPARIRLLTSVVARVPARRRCTFSSQTGCQGPLQTAGDNPPRCPGNALGSDSYGGGSALEACQCEGQGSPTRRLIPAILPPATITRRSRT